MRPYILTIMICWKGGPKLRSEWLPVECQVSQKVKVIHLTLLSKSLECIMSSLNDNIERNKKVLCKGGATENDHIVTNFIATHHVNSCGGKEKLF